MEARATAIQGGELPARAGFLAVEPEGLVVSAIRRADDGNEAEAVAMAKKLESLLEKISPLRVSGASDVDVTGLSSDSRRLRPGNVFVALPGRRTDGNAFVDQAMRKGAAAIVSERANSPAESAVPYIVVENARRALSRLAAAMYDSPAQRLHVIGVTGTDGKTTTAHLISAVLEAAGIPAGRVTTVDVAIGSLVRRNETNHTTPQAPFIHSALAEMVRAGAEYAVLEASSHALALDRVADCAFDVAVMTNLTPEHLDFHGTFERYREAKARLFRMLAEPTAKPWPRFGVVNADDPAAEYFRHATPVPMFSYGVNSPADLRAEAIETSPEGSSFVIVGPAGRVEVDTRLPGRFNVYNWLAAASVAFGLGLAPEAVARAATAGPVVPGRMIRVQEGQPFGVVVDFAHTPNALDLVLRTLRPQTKGRLIAVFGHAGGRDFNNRPEMGRTAARLADFFVITSDDPYDEDPAAIIDQIGRGAQREGLRLGVDYLKVVDRREAIASALREARPGDTVLIAGRGHERVQTVGRRKLVFDDVEVTRELLAQAQGARGRSAA